MIILIAAMSSDRVIGYENKMPWHIKSELTHFRSVTSGHTILMGRNTYDSIGGPLPNRTNIIITSRPLESNAPNLEVHHNLRDVLNKYTDDTTLFIVGGAQIYQSTMPFADEIILSIIPGAFAGDTFFPPISENDFMLVKTVEHDEFSVRYYKRNK